jgi:ESCRT-II complex subunit VPS25
MKLRDFPPLYTLQKVLSTRDKQLQLWRQVVMSSLDSGSTAILDITTFEAFSNEAIARSLSLESRRIVGDFVIESGFGEWEDPTTKTLLRVYTKTPEAWSAIVYTWAQSCGLVGQEISTFYEIHSGEGAEGTELEGIHPDVLHKALKVLESQGRAFLYPGSSLDEMGVKFQ